MNEQEYEQLKSWFHSYTDGYINRPDGGGENILLKRDHTLRVCDNMEILTAGLGPDERWLAMAAALLHDIGRFEQLIRHGTFSDFRSEDHASLGVEIMKELRVLESFSLEEAAIVLDAVENHNKGAIDPELPDRTIRIAELVRDADKLDIWHLVIGYYREGREKDNPSLVHNLPPGDDVCLPVYEAVLRGDIISYDVMETVVDMKILQMGWVYDLNTNKALRLAAERRHIDGIFETIPHTDRILEIYSAMQEYIHSKLKGECYA